MKQNPNNPEAGNNLVSGVPMGISGREDTAPTAAAISAKAWVDCRATLVEARVRVGALPKTRETAIALTKIDEAVLWLDASLLNRDDREVSRG